ncbi:GNAT family N-acetyltransferase [Mesorhizobium sp. YM1C-6-2]|uniref:GNAT family N-acetyltransferase n=1 Tax=Mesorhizobium sp. YM1C-6-2 TaxID=1827501 RepID=UPI000EF255AD|nr:GNAT family N-acetyltransferase [Mesorhizobium sp. YM1C-6-2]RLP23771.1 GNAT family N-acetyltransferase [Mesorhizobium sp. YM1C-6-2]
MSEISIRFATVEDAEDIFSALVGIAETVKELHKLKSSVDDIRRFGFGETPAFEVLIAEIDGRFAGCCLYFPSFSTWIGRPGVYVQDFYVADEFRGKGIGERLLQRLASVTRKRGGCYIRLAVDTQNFRAQAFYARAGIKHSDTEQIHAAYDTAFHALADADPDD